MLRTAGRSLPAPAVHVLLPAWYRRLVAVPVPLLLGITGASYFSAAAYLAETTVPLGSPRFFTVASVMALAFGLMLARVWETPRTPRSLLLVAFGLAVLFRLPLAVVDPGRDSDLIRYLWDGRVQHLGYNPYLVVPADPRLAETHTDQTRGMSSARWRTPYLPAAQLFFRFTVAVRDSSLAMKLALTACDLLTIVVLWQWLRRTGRNEWLALVYAWHPLVILELAHSAHIDALLVLMLTAAASWLARGRSTLAILAFVMAVMVKPLPVVLAPLFIGHVRGRDLVAGLGLAVALYIPFLSPHELPLGLMPGLVQGLRFNGPIYLLIGWATLPAIAAAVAVGAGLTAAMAARKRWGPSRPESWGWPMAIALALAPMVYPWYLVSLVPFLVARTTLPILAWTLSVLPVYVVWVRAARGGAWSVPPAVLAVEYSVVLLTAVVLWRSRTRLGAQAE